LNVEVLESRTLPAALTGTIALPPILLDGLSAGSSPAVLEGPNGPKVPQDLGTLAPADLVKGVTIVGGLQGETADYYQFQVTQTRQFVVALGELTSTTGIPPGTWLSVNDTTIQQPLVLEAWSNVVSPDSQVNVNGQIMVTAWLHPGAVYVLQITNFSPGALYVLRIAYAGAQPEMPQPLSVGAANAIRLRLVNNGAGLPAASAPSALEPASPINPSTAALRIVLPAIVSGSSDGTRIVAASNPSASELTSIAAPPGAGNVPTAVFVALGAGSVGGFPGTSSATTTSAPDLYDRIYGQAPALALNERLIGLAILSQIGTATNGDAAEPSRAAGSDRPNLRGWWQNLFRFGEQEAAVAPGRSVSKPPLATTGVLNADASPEEEEEDLLLLDDA
jgi:hypothetical protein